MNFTSFFGYKLIINSCYIIDVLLRTNSAIIAKDRSKNRHTGNIIWQATVLCFNLYKYEVLDHKESYCTLNLTMILSIEK